MSEQEVDLAFWRIGWRNADSASQHGCFPSGDSWVRRIVLTRQFHRLRHISERV